MVLKTAATPRDQQSLRFSISRVGLGEVQRFSVPSLLYLDCRFWRSSEIQCPFASVSRLQVWRSSEIQCPFASVSRLQRTIVLSYVGSGEVQRFNVSLFLLFLVVRADLVSGNHIPGRPLLNNRHVLQMIGKGTWWVRTTLVPLLKDLSPKHVPSRIGKSVLGPGRPRTPHSLFERLAWVRVYPDTLQSPIQRYIQ